MQSQQMAAMGMNVNMGGPVEGTPIMGNAQRSKVPEGQDSRAHLNTYIYDYFKRNNHLKLAKMMIEADLNMSLNTSTKRSPNGRNVNGVDALEDDLPAPNLPDHQLAENSFLLDWWAQFWDIWSAARMRSTKTQTSQQYIVHSRNLAQMQTDQRTQRMMMNNGMNAAQYQNMMRAMPNGVPQNANDLKRAAALNRNPNGANPMANMNQMKSQAMMAQQMQRDGSQMDMNGQRPGSPGSSENAPSPNKRPRVEGGMNPTGMAGNQFNEFAQQGQGLQQKTLEGMNAAVQGSPMNHQIDGQSEIFAGNPPRPGMPAAPGAPQGNHALQDYQMQLMLLEQQNKKRLLMARQEQDSMSGGPPHGQSAVGAPGFPPAMSPQGSRAGPSPNPTDQMKRGTPKMNQQGLPGSPMPDPSMQQQRNSPAPNMNFDPSQMPPGMPPQFAYPQMPQNPMNMRPPSSHPGGFNGQQLNPAQLDAMRRSGAMQNGNWQQGGPPQAMMQNQGLQQGGPMNNPQQRNNMPPPPAPPAGEAPRTQEASPAQPAAPPTPSQTNKAGPKKKATNDKKPPKAKGANTGATPAASEDPPQTPTPSTPITPMHAKSFNGPNGQPQAAPAPVQQPPAQPPQQAPMDNATGPFGNIGDDTNFDLGLGGFDATDTLDNFDFDSFLHVGGDDPGGFGGGFSDLNFGDTAEVGEGI